MKTFSRVAEVKTNEKKSCTSLFLVLKTRKIEKKSSNFLFEFFYQLFFVSKILYFLSRKRKKLSHFRLTVFFSNPVERFRGPTIQRMFVVRLYSKLIARFRAMPTRPTLRILSCDTNRRKTTILAFCIAGLPIVWEEWNHLVLSNLFLQVRKNPL